MRNKAKERIGMVFVASALVVAAPSFSFAGSCETAAAANPQMERLVNTDISNINKYVSQEAHFIRKDLTQTAQTEILARLDEFESNLLGWLNDWWTNRFHRALKRMTAQLATARTKHVEEVGFMMDAQLVNELLQKQQEMELEAKRRYAPSEGACQMDTAAVGMLKAQRLSKDLSRGLAQDNTGVQMNRKGTIAADARGAGMKALFDEYAKQFCDPSIGDQGCDAPGVTPQMHKDLGALLWGDKQTIDMSNVDNQIGVAAVLRYLASPLPPDPIPPRAVGGSGPNQALLQRRAHTARVNTIYNTVGTMLAERASGSGVNSKDLRTTAGKPLDAVSDSASYRELQQALGRERFYDPRYIVRLVQDPHILTREQGTIHAMRQQAMHDLYRRAEEMLFLTAADYASDLDGRIPGNAIGAAPMTPKK